MTSNKFLHFTSLSWQISVELWWNSPSTFSAYKDSKFSRSEVPSSHQNAWKDFFKICNSFKIIRASVLLFPWFMVALSDCKLWQIFHKNMFLEFPPFTHTWTLRSSCQQGPVGQKPNGVLEGGGRTSPELECLYKQSWGRLEFEVSVNEN